MIPRYRGNIMANIRLSRYLNFYTSCHFEDGFRRDRGDPRNDMSGYAIVNTTLIARKFLKGYEDLYKDDPHKAALAWFKDARFGLFIHYGLYSILGRGEWVLYREKIPIPEYEKLTERFNPEKCDADGSIVETYEPEGPMGAKEAGEGTQLSPAPAIVNAIYDAIGVDFMELPITPEKILDALEAKKNLLV